MIYTYADGTATISSRGQWLPGLYESARAARYAFRLPSSTLQTLASTSPASPSATSPSATTITYDQLKAAYRKHHPIKHNRNTYSRGLCKCETCTRANAAYSKKLRELHIQRLPYTTHTLKHGKHSTYVQHGCHCTLCTQAALDYQHKYRPPKTDRRKSHLREVAHGHELIDQLRELLQSRQTHLPHHSLPDQGYNNPAQCECGATTPTPITTRTGRQNWHREHKIQLLTAQNDAPLNSPLNPLDC